MKRAATVVLLSLCCHFAFAGPIADRFGTNIVGFPWGVPLDSIVGVFPQGDHVYSTAPGERSYAIKDNQDFLGVPRAGQNILYSFGRQNELVSVTFSFPYERRDEIQGALMAAFGAPASTAPWGRQKASRWLDEKGVAITLVASTEPRYGIVWLSISGPNYPRNSALKSSERKR